MEVTGDPLQGLPALHLPQNTTPERFLKTMSNLNPHNEHDPMSDARLDELLDLAKPKLDPARQTALRRVVGQTLKSNRPSWWMLVRPNTLDSRSSAISLLVAGCCLLMLVGFGWLATPDSNRNQPATVAGTSEPDVALKPLTLSGSELARLYPPIISQSRSQARSNREKASEAIQRGAAQLRSRPFVPVSRKRVRELSHSSPSPIEASLLTIAGSDFGRMLVDQFANELDKAAANIATNRADLLSSPVRRSEKERGLLAIKRQDERLQFAHQQLESYLANAVERFPEQQARSAYRILCRVGSESSLPLILKYRNIESTQADAALAISKLADARLLEQLVLETSDTSLQSQLMAGLLCRHDTASLDLFLELTARHDLYSAAQKSGGIANCAPTEILLQRLRSNRTSIARAAAVTMSGMKDPNITTYLLQLANHPESFQSALMALTARTDDCAIQFVQLASNDIRWSATVINEKKKWSRILVLN